MVMKISCKFEKASYNIFFVRTVKVKSLYTLRRRNKAKYIIKYIQIKYTFYSRKSGSLILVQVELVLAFERPRL